MKKIRLLLFLLIGLVIIQACVKTADFNFSKLTKPVYDGEWAAPLISSNITLKDILKNQNGLIQSDAQGNLIVTYSLKNLFSQTAEETIRIPNQHLIQSTNFLTPALGTGATYNYSFTPDIPLTGATVNQQLDSIYVKSGSLRIQISTNFNKTTALNLKITSLIHRTTRQLVTIPQMTLTPSAPGNFVDIDISDCILIMKTINNTKNNIHFDLGMTLQGNTNPTLSNYTLNLDTQFTNLKFSALYGKLGNFTMNLSNSLDIGIFNNSIGGAFQFAPGAINLKLNIDNSFGMPVQLNVKNFTSHSDAATPHDIAINLFGPTIPNIINLDVPTVFGENKTTTVLTTNSNIQDALNTSPDKIYFNADATTNPLNNGSLNFVSDQSKINVNMDVLMKLYGSITNFAIQDTLIFNYKNLDQLENMTFRVNTTNGFPLAVKLQLYFTDDSYRILDTMFPEPLDYIIKPASIGSSPDYKVTSPTEYQFPDIIYDQTRIGKIKTAQKIILKASMNTINNSIVKIYETNYIDIKLSLKTKLKVN
jgi:hypothetical protein